MNTLHSTFVNNSDSDSLSRLRGRLYLRWTTPPISTRFSISDCSGSGLFCTTLRISNATVNETGQYQCSYKDLRVEDGKTSAAAYVFVNGKQTIVFVEQSQSYGALLCLIPTQETVYLKTWPTYRSFDVKCVCSKSLPCMGVIWVSVSKWLGILNICIQVNMTKCCNPQKSFWGLLVWCKLTFFPNRNTMKLYLVFSCLFQTTKYHLCHLRKNMRWFSSVKESGWWYHAEAQWKISTLHFTL